MAATTSKPQLSSLRTKTLKTPVSATSATYPSEMRSPMPGTPSFAKPDQRFEPVKTPISPPTAYLDFLQKLSPTLMTPPASCPLRTSFSKPPLSAATSYDSISTTASSASITSTASATSEASRPDTPSTSVSAYSSSTPPCVGESKKPEQSAEIPPGPSTAPLPATFKRPQTARRPRLQIPQSPISPSSVRSPLSSSNSVYSPWSATISPRDRDSEKGPNSARAVKVRHIITRTVTYARPITPIVEPVPASKKRKVESAS